MLKQLLMSRYLWLIFVFCASFTLLQDERTRYFPRYNEVVEEMPSPDSVWLFILAGQSNMAGRGLVEPQDTVPDPHIFSLTPDMKWVVAKEPLQLYQPSLSGLGPGLSFAKSLTENLAGDVYIGLIPCAVGGSSVDNWLSDSLYHGIRLRSNLTEKVAWAHNFGTVKAIIWHQGEADATAEKIPVYHDKLISLFGYFRDVSGNDTLPVIMGELGIFAGNEKNNDYYRRINKILETIAAEDDAIVLVPSCGLRARADNVHFDNVSQRIMGKRYAEAYFNLEDSIKK